MTTYDEYLSMHDTLTFEEAVGIIKQISDSINPNSEDDVEILTDFLNAAANYAKIRADWYQMPREKRMDIDSHRTACHNLVIFHLNLLSRYLAQKGCDVSWREKLGDESEYRKRIGDFACYVACIQGLGAR